MATISSFKANLINGGARASQFRVELAFPGFVTGGIVASQRAQFLCKAASLPGSTIDPLPVYYRGRQVNVAGERTFQPWSITVYNDTTFGIRNSFEAWQSGIMGHASTDGRTSPFEYQVDMTVHQLDRDGSIIKSYKFIDAMPIEISPIQLDYDAGSTIEMFDVTFVYNYFQSNTGIDSAGSAFGINISVDTPIGTLPLPI